MLINTIIKLKVKHFKRNDYDVAKLLGNPVDEREVGNQHKKVGNRCSSGT